VGGLITCHLLRKIINFSIFPEIAHFYKGVDFNHLSLEVGVLEQKLANIQKAD